MPTSRSHAAYDLHAVGFSAASPDRLGFIMLRSFSRNSRTRKAELRILSCCKFPAILNRPEPARLMGAKVGESHLAGQHKSHGTRKEANHEQQSTERFQHSRSPHQGKEG